MSITEHEFMEEISDIIIEYDKNLRAEVELRLNNWTFDHESSAMHNVISGLLSRQTAITLEVMGSPPILHGVVIHIILRSMIDVYLTMAWIFHSDSENRAQKFIDYGVGQEKMMKDFREAELKSLGINPDEDPGIRASNMLINIMKTEELVDVNIGNWSGLNARQMAEESGNLSFYNLTYLPFTQDVHSNWPCIVRFNLAPCNSPLHKLHFVGDLKGVKSAFHLNLRNVLKYMDKVLTLFDKNIKTDLSSIKKPASDILRSRMKTLMGKIKENE